MVSAGETTDVRAIWVWGGGQEPQLLHIHLDVGSLNGVFALKGWEWALGISWESWAGYKKLWGVADVLEEDLGCVFSGCLLLMQLCGTSFLFFHRAFGLFIFFPVWPPAGHVLCVTQQQGCGGADLLSSWCGGFLPGGCLRCLLPATSLPEIPLQGLL